MEEWWECARKLMLFLLQILISTLHAWRFTTPNWIEWQKKVKKKEQKWKTEKGRHCCGERERLAQLRVTNFSSLSSYLSVLFYIYMYIRISLLFLPFLLWLGYSVHNIYVGSLRERERVEEIIYIYVWIVGYIYIYTTHIFHICA